MAEVRVAKSAGFCYGVERAVKLAEETAREKGGCAMLGSIIHNVHVVAELEALGARQVDSVEEVRPGETVIIRSHGERKEVFDRLEQLGAVCVNATCPNVLRIQQLVAQADREGRCVVLPCMIGDNVYVLNHHLGRVFENEVTGFSVGYPSDNRNSVSTVYVGKCGSKTFRRWKFQQFWKTVFLTREDAEAALKEAEE